MTIVQQINASTPFLEGVPNSQVSKAWYRVLLSIVSVLSGASSSIDLAAFETEIYTQRGPAGSVSDLRAIVDRLEILQSLVSRISNSIKNNLEQNDSDIEKLLLLSRVNNSMKNNLDQRDSDIEKLLLLRRAPSINNQLANLTGANFVDMETPTGTPNGILVTFTLANTPNPPASCIGYVRQGGAGAFVPAIYGVDFTLSGATVTMTAAPDTSSNLLFSYRKAT